MKPEIYADTIWFRINRFQLNHRLKSHWINCFCFVLRNSNGNFLLHLWQQRCEFAALHAPFYVKLLFACIKRINSFFCVLVCFKTRAIANGIVSQLWARDSLTLASRKKRMKTISHIQPAVSHCHWIIFDSLNRQYFLNHEKMALRPNGISWVFASTKNPHLDYRRFNQYFRSISLIEFYLSLPWIFVLHRESPRGYTEMQTIYCYSVVNVPACLQYSNELFCVCTMLDIGTNHPAILFIFIFFFSFEKKKVRFYRQHFHSTWNSWVRNAWLKWKMQPTIAMSSFRKIVWEFCAMG